MPIHDRAVSATRRPGSGYHKREPGEPGYGHAPVPMRHKAAAEEVVVKRMSNTVELIVLGLSRSGIAPM